MTLRQRIAIVQTPDEKALGLHWKVVGAMRCVVCGNPSVTLHHAKGGSMRDLLGDAGNPGKGAKVSDWLVIPLNWRYHTGDLGIDTGQGPYKDKRAWELHFGTQVSHLVTVSLAVGFNVFHRAGFMVDLPELRHISTIGEGRLFP
jgi:hypothetical protein